MGKDVEVAILFADVVGSTQLYEQLGDVKARQMVARCLDIMREATEVNRGTVIKTMGDEVMSTFPAADDAMNAAKRMQERISTDAELTHDNGRVAIRIGCHYGPVVQEQRDVFGSAVHTANRMTSQAKAKQIITTLSTVQKLSAEWQAASRQIDIATVRGKADEVVLFEVLWQPEEATSMLPDRRARSQIRGSTEAPDAALSGPRGYGWRRTQERHARSRRGQRRGRQRQSDLARSRADRIEPRQIYAHRRKHERHLRADEQRRGDLRPPRQHAAHGEGVIGLGRVAQPARR